MSEQDATLEEGVSESKTKREQELERIRAKRVQELSGEVEGTAPKEELGDEGGQPSDYGDPAPAEKTLKFYGDDGTEYEIPETAKARLKVDGKEIEEPLTKVTSRYQKGAAGDLRLQEANRVKQELEAKEETLAKRGQELTAKEQEYIRRVKAANIQSKTPDPSKDGQMERKELIAALIDADEDKAEKAFSRLGAFSQQPAPPQADPKAIDAQVGQAVEAKLKEREQVQVKKDREAAVKWFFEERADLAEDAYLRSAVDRETAVIMRESPDKPPLEVMQEAARKVQIWIDGKANKPVNGAKKKATPTPASGRRSMGEDSPPPPTRKERINQIRQRRGQAPL